MQLLWVISSTILLYAGAVPLIRLPMRREIVDPVYPRYGLIANLSVSNQNLGALVNNETPLIYFIFGYFHSSSICGYSIFGCFYCYPEVCVVSLPPINVTLGDGTDIQLLGTSGIFDIAEQSGLIVSFASEVSLRRGPDEHFPSSVLGFGFSQDRPLFRTPLIDQLVKNPSGYIKSRSFSLYLESGSLARGEVLLGGVDPDKFIGPLSLMPVVGEGHWMIRLLAVNVGGASMRQAGLHAILDTGTNGISMPAKAREDLTTLIRVGAKKPIDIRLVGDRYEIDCADRKYLPAIELSFEGVD